MNKIIRYILIGLGILLLGSLLWYLRSIVVYIVIAGLIGLIGSPLVDFICRFPFRGYRLPRWVGAGVTLFLFWFTLAVFFSIIIPLLASEANELSKIDVNTIVENLKGPITRVQHYFERYNLGPAGGFSLKDYAIEKLTPLLDISRLSGVFTAVAGVFGNIFIAVFSISFISFFFLKEEGLFSSFLRMLIPDKFQDSVMHIIEAINKLLVRYFLGIILEVLFVMLLNAIGLSLIGLSPSRALIVALFAGVMNVVPYIGPLIGIVFGLSIGVATHLSYDFYSELLPLLGLMFAVMTTVQVIDNTVFQPVIYSSSVNAHPLEIFLVILVAGNLAGIVGMILAIPTYTIIRVIAKEFFNNYELVKRLTARM